MGATKHIVQDRIDLVNPHRYPVSLQIFIFGNDHKESVLKIRTYLREENALLLQDALYAPGVRCSLVSFVYEINSLLFSPRCLTYRAQRQFVWPCHIERCFQYFGQNKPSFLFVSFSILF